MSGAALACKFMIFTGNFPLFLLYEKIKYFSDHLTQRIAVNYITHV
jgi:hypothetical protein